MTQTAAILPVISTPAFRPWCGLLTLSPLSQYLAWLSVTMTTAISLPVLTTHTP